MYAVYIGFTWAYIRCIQSIYMLRGIYLYGLYTYIYIHIYIYRAYIHTYINRAYIGSMEGL